MVVDARGQVGCHCHHCCRCRVAAASGLLPFPGMQLEPAVLQGVV